MGVETKIWDLPVEIIDHCCSFLLSDQDKYNARQSHRIFTEVIKPPKCKFHSYVYKDELKGREQWIKNHLGIDICTKRKPHRIIHKIMTPHLNDTINQMYYRIFGYDKKPVSVLIIGKNKKILKYVLNSLVIKKHCGGAVFGAQDLLKKYTPDGSHLHSEKFTGYIFRLFQLCQQKTHRYFTMNDANYVILQNSPELLSTHAWKKLIHNNRRSNTDVVVQLDYEPVLDNLYHFYQNFDVVIFKKSKYNQFFDSYFGCLVQETELTRALGTDATKRVQEMYNATMRSKKCLVCRNNNHYSGRETFLLSYTKLASQQRNLFLSDDIFWHLAHRESKH